ncbi:60S ribosomal protein L21-B [Komagataella phaffii CBS 7435]|uniref:60S ribosomal protein L21 n=2 Tax=Komagataella phaffii TaxID=460519 RepID=C4QYE9_KOMPG|nr:60S ribosomal protein L21 [Komagataella phaffii GS115]AOA61193.1 GQ67_01739T0 [Komagataella phaffii]CAH2447095.1 60S ribosomal protein L21-B [Komagataella phaffii CBS 7435]AOA66250.1 GQ68_01754T0 [Komagataella phaffii GS115]CAY68272.1 60S ribosomal protein L21 [Komagataella phaffii GS115]CCA37342.1 60S ribosomal protein L21-B [Komagataella phaffii CBS 7435]
MADVLHFFIDISSFLHFRKPGPTEHTNIQSSRGYRSGTRYAFSRDFKKHGAVPMSTYLRLYKIGDYVDIKANGAIQKGMPHKFYHGKTGVVFNVTKTSVSVLINKVVGNRYIEKKVNLRVEHVKPSKCREEFLNRVKEHQKNVADAKESGKSVAFPKRQPVGPRPSHVVSGEPITLAPVAYETFI